MTSVIIEFRAFSSLSLDRDGLKGAISTYSSPALFASAVSRRVGKL